MTGQLLPNKGGALAGHLAIHSTIYILAYMNEGWDIEIEPEVRQWLDNLSDRDYLQAEHVVERLLDAPTTLGEPYSRHLGEGLRELRFALGHDGNAIRLTYWLTQNRRIVLLTVFRKTRMREDAEVARAKQAMKVCETARHTAHDEFNRDVTKGEG